jgi:hypothetical protein
MTALILCFWSLGFSLLITYACYRERRIQAALRGSRSLAAKAGAHCECSMVCNHCGRYKVHPDNSVR